jgi:hypothetical protein
MLPRRPDIEDEEIRARGIQAHDGSHIPAPEGVAEPGFEGSDGRLIVTHGRPVGGLRKRGHGAEAGDQGSAHQA